MLLKFPGICLPRNILDLFPAQTSTGTYVSNYLSTELDMTSSSIVNIERDQPQITSSTLIVNEIGDRDDLSSVDSMSDISVSARSNTRKWPPNRHNRADCLQCCRLRLFTKELNVKRKSLVYNSDISFNSPESCFSDDSGSINLPDKSTMNILRHVQRMANPVWSKQSKTFLLDMKQKYPQSFQDICLYSEVCSYLASNTYRLCSRRFLQELFLDLDYDCFYNDLNVILGRKDFSITSNFSASSSSSGVPQQISNNLSGDGLQIDVDRPDNDQNNRNKIATNFSKILSNGMAAMTVPLYIQTANLPPNPIKSHLKSPPLASLYETSVENLLEASGTPKDAVNHFNNCKLVKQKSTESQNQPKYKSRPRFNTLELDLSCTKNKFPIRDRSKVDYSPTISINSSSHSVTTPTSLAAKEMPNLFCEKRLLTSSRSLSTLSKK